MRITKFRIKNYLSILDSGEVILEPAITTLIGENESGKTCVLKALETFNGEFKYSIEQLCLHSDTKTELESGTINEKDIEIVTLWFEMEEEDKRKLKSINPQLVKIKNLKVTKYFDNSYSSESPDISLEDIKTNIKKKLNKNISEIKNISTVFKEKLDNHSKRNPPFSGSKAHYDEVINEIISFDPVTNPEIDKVFTNSFNRLVGLPNADAPIQNDIQAFIEEINPHKDSIKETLSKKEEDVREEALEMLPSLIYFSDIEKLEDIVALSEYISKKERHKTLDNLIKLSNLNVDSFEGSGAYARISKLRTASARITGDINQFWTQEKVEVNLDIREGEIIISILDDVINNYHPPSIRSQGFRWFLSFYINFMAGSKGELKNAIILLDDPGVYLHASRQKDFLNALEKISQSNQIVFSTHSPFMIDREKLRRVRIVTKKVGKGTLIEEKYWDSKGDALAPIRASIGMKIGDSLFTTKNNLLVEGYSDEIILGAMSKLCLKKGEQYIDTSKISVFPVTGADKMSLFATFCKIENFKFLVFLDFDTKGRSTSKELENKYKINRNNIMMLDKFAGQGKDLVIEDLIDFDFYLEALNAAYEEIFQNKLKKKSIKKDDLKKTTFNGIKDFFKEKQIGTSGRVDKIKVAKEINDLVVEGKVPSEETTSKFLKLFKIINEKLETS